MNWTDRPIPYKPQPHDSCLCALARGFTTGICKHSDHAYPKAPTFAIEERLAQEDAGIPPHPGDVCVNRDPVAAECCIGYVFVAMDVRRTGTMNMDHDWARYASEMKAILTERLEETHERNGTSALLIHRVWPTCIHYPHPAPDKLNQPYFETYAHRFLVEVYAGVAKFLIADILLGRLDMQYKERNSYLNVEYHLVSAPLLALTSIQVETMTRKLNDGSHLPAVPVLSRGPPKLAAVTGPDALFLAAWKLKNAHMLAAPLPGNASTNEPSTEPASSSKGPQPKKATPPPRAKSARILALKAKETAPKATHLTRRKVPKRLVSDGAGA
ncbi:hypothetical protein CALVIDRAFT_294137 [Calocera viscosa TUFC12733]|uniref:Uncharacterized protein n=1 Tax=Calocera viscosa (strain TUFC12733) TaxID=1330018 RepID=A0A167ILY7_CALVF|nr:hypothetical protein CALVIDRAFT_294137 [Calocera viscosa TUFC12733]